MNGSLSNISLIPLQWADFPVELLFNEGFRISESWMPTGNGCDKKSLPSQNISEGHWVCLLTEGRICSIPGWSSSTP
jgi:hypothetical protein